MKMLSFLSPFFYHTAPSSFSGFLDSPPPFPPPPRPPSPVAAKLSASREEESGAVEMEITVWIPGEEEGGAVKMEVTVWIPEAVLPLGDLTTKLHLFAILLQEGSHIFLPQDLEVWSRNWICTSHEYP